MQYLVFRKVEEGFWNLITKEKKAVKIPFIFHECINTSKFIVRRYQNIGS